MVRRLFVEEHDPRLGLRSDGTLGKKGGSGSACCGEDFGGGILVEVQERDGVTFGVESHGLDVEMASKVFSAA